MIADILKSIKDRKQELYKATVVKDPYSASLEEIEHHKFIVQEIGFLSTIEHEIESIKVIKKSK